MSLGLFIKRRAVWMLCALVAAMVLIFVLWPEPKTPRPPPLPSPNGYDDFVTAGTLVARTGFDYRKVPLQELRAYLSTNQEPLRLVRIGLAKECQVPLEDSVEAYRKNSMKRSGFRQLPLLIAAEGRLAELEARFDDAARIHFDNVRFGHLSAKGGLIMNKLASLAFEAIGMIGLERVVDELSVTQARELIPALEAMNTKPASASEYIMRDREWDRKFTSLPDRIRSIWTYQTLHPERAADQLLITKIQTTDRRRRQLILTLATRAYELEHGKRPSRAEELVPSVLRAIPKDPETGTNLVLHPTP